MGLTKSLSKSLWRKIEQDGFHFYCVGCNRQRRLSAPAKIGTMKFYSHIALTTAFVSVLTWHWFEWKGMVAWFIPIAITFEIIYRVRMRAALVCPDCKFDPILYLVDRKRAVGQVEAAWRQQFESKGFAFPERKPQRSSKTA